MLCVICMAQKINTVFYPCGHSSLCIGCAKKLTDKKCVSCRSDAKWIKTYESGIIDDEQENNLRQKTKSKNKLTLEKTIEMLHDELKQTNEKYELNKKEKEKSKKANRNNKKSIIDDKVKNNKLLEVDIIAMYEKFNKTNQNAKNRDSAIKKITESNSIVKLYNNNMQDADIINKFGSAIIVKSNGNAQLSKKRKIINATYDEIIFYDDDNNRELKVKKNRNIFIYT